ncbi:MAG: pyruvate kinase, partial [Proteobacteria bacterium]|nr:pyruvate kinase [Pseudomonadota bacterium]
MNKNKPLKRTKIIATLGPASSSKEALSKLLLSGVNLIRLNFSHGEGTSHLETLKLVRETAEELKLPIGVIADLQGPRIRTGLLKDKSVTLNPGAKITITTAKGDDFQGDARVITTTYKGLAKDVGARDRILIDDGLIELKVLKVRDCEVECEVIYGGTLSEHKGVNIPGVKLGIPALSEKDLSDLDIAIKGGVDYIAISFVQSANDVEHLKELIRKAGSQIPVIAKIESMKAVVELEAIVNASYALMIARGDLGVELSPEKVPILQKKIIEMANEAGKPVITATQMLESMIKN